MALNPAQLRASLQWEAACERLRNALQPPVGMGAFTSAQRVVAVELAQQALEAVRTAYAADLEAASKVGTDAPAPHRDLVAIGAAQGGVPALIRLVRELPTGFSAAVLVALQHREDSALLFEIKRSGVAVPVAYGRKDDPIQPGHVYLTPPKCRMFVEPSGLLGVERSAAGEASAHVIDRLFASVARTYGPRAIGVILSGCDGDGVDGMDAIEEADGIGIVQDPEDAQEDALPSHVISKDRPHYVARLDDIAALLDTLIDGHRPSHDA